MSLGEQDVLVVWIGATVLEHAMVNVLIIMKLAKTSEHLSNNNSTAQFQVKHDS
jgi:hypothetical protein